MAKQKFYVVWDGAEDGVFTSWEACQEAVKGYSNAKYKAFKTESEAEEAFEMGYDEWKKKEETHPNPSCEEGGSHSECSQNEGEVRDERAEVKSASVQNDGGRPVPDVNALPAEVNRNAIAVDAACSGNPGKMEYRGVYLKTGKEIFHFGPVHGTNNIGEFLAIVHGLALLKQKGLNDMPIYSDSVNAQLWVRKKECKTTLQRNEKTEELYQMIARAEAWLHNNSWQNQIIKWPTEKWGEIPADFGRK